MRRVRWLLVPVALLVGGAVTAVALAAGERGRVVVTAEIAWLGVQAGVAAAVVIAIVLAVTGALRRREERGRAAGAAAERAERRRVIDRLDHELKNPITALRAGIEALPPSQQTTGLREQALRLSRLTGDLRRLGELESAPLEIAPVDLEEVAREVRESLEELPDADRRELVLAFPRAPRPLPPVPGDADLLFLAVHNLAANAVKYSEPGDRIEFRGSEEDGWVALEIADTGLGIPTEEQDVVWEQLARGSRVRGIPGSGLGLAFVRTIVQRHGGEVGLRSRLGEGTVVRLRLPIRSGSR